MRYLQRVLLLVLVLVVCVSTAAHADSTTIPNGVEIKVDGKSVDRNLKWVYLNASQCTGNVPISLAVTTQFPENPKVLEVWVGPTSSNCATGANRNQPTSGDPPCTQIEITNDQSPGFTPTVDDLTARKLFGGDETGTCGLDGERWVHILALSSESQSTNNTDVDTKHFVRVGFYVDVDLPDAPTKPSASGGESTVSVSWTASSEISSSTDSRIRVYYDPDAISDAGGACDSSDLVEGEVPDSALKYKQTSGSSTKFSTSPGVLGLEKTGQQVPVAVAAVDAAGNVSELSEVVCVTKEDTIGFQEACENNEECSDGFDSCSAAPWRGVSGAAGTLMLGATALWLARRRRRNV